MSRIPELIRDELDADAQRLYDEILAARGSIAGPFRVWLYSPEFTRRATQLGEFLRYHTSLPPRLSELIILITSRSQRSEVEWAIHEPLARKAGLPANVIEALRNDSTPMFASDEERVIYNYCEELHRSLDELTQSTFSNPREKGGGRNDWALWILHNGRNDAERIRCRC